MIVDLTHTLNNNITVYPGTVHPTFEPGNTIKKDSFAELNIKMSTHSGTHIDAPAHIFPNGKSSDKFPIEKFVGKAIVIDCSEKDSIGLDLLKPLEARIKQTHFILFYSGWQEKWNTPNYFDEFPTLTTEAIEWLLNFDLKALGFDTISVDKLKSNKLPNHHLLLEKEVLIIENMTNLEKLINTQFELNCIPLKIENSDGSPVRAFARILSEQ